MKTVRTVAGMLSIIVASSFVCVSTFAAPQESTSYIFWPEVEAWVSNGEYLYGLPSVEARLYKLEDGERTDVVLSDKIGDYLLNVFEVGEEEIEGIDVKLDDTIIVSMKSQVGPQNDQYVEFFVEKTVDCLKSLDDVEEARDFANFMLDPDQGVVTSAGLKAVVDFYKPTATKMLREFRSHRCTEVNNDFVPNTAHESQIEAAAKGILLGIEDVVHFSEVDLMVMVQVMDGLYLGTNGFFSVNSIYMIKDAIMVGMDTLSDFIENYSGQSYSMFIKFVSENINKTISERDIEEIDYSCVEKKCSCITDYFQPFNLETCYLSGGIVFDSITLGDTTRSFIGGK
jgi:hypothetical protein